MAIFRGFTSFAEATREENFGLELDRVDVVVHVWLLIGLLSAPTTCYGRETSHLSASIFASKTLLAEWVGKYRVIQGMLDVL